MNYIRSLSELKSGDKIINTTPRTPTVHSIFVLRESEGEPEIVEYYISSSLRKSIPRDMFASLNEEIDYERLLHKHFGKLMAGRDKKPEQSEHSAAPEEKKKSEDEEFEAHRKFVERMKAHTAFMHGQS